MGKTATSKAASKGGKTKGKAVKARPPVQHKLPAWVGKITVGDDDVARARFQMANATIGFLKKSDSAFRLVADLIEAGTVWSGGVRLDTDDSEVLSRFADALARAQSAQTLNAAGRNRLERARRAALAQVATLAQIDEILADIAAAEAAAETVSDEDTEGTDEVSDETGSTVEGDPAPDAEVSEEVQA